MHLEHQAQAIRIMGIELRTSNIEAMHTIPQHWGRFISEGLLGRIPGKLGEDVYAVYTHFENAGHDNHGMYSLILGAAVASIQTVPEGFSHAVIPACPRAVFSVPGGNPQLVAEVWQQIWAHHDLPKAYIADYERYRPDGQIDIFVGLLSNAPAKA